MPVLVSFDFFVEVKIQITPFDKFIVIKLIFLNYEEFTLFNYFYGDFDLDNKFTVTISALY